MTAGTSLLEEVHGRLEGVRRQKGHALDRSDGGSELSLAEVALVAVVGILKSPLESLRENLGPLEDLAAVCEDSLDVDNIH